MDVAEAGQSPWQRRSAILAAGAGIAATVEWTLGIFVGGRRPRLYASGTEIVAVFAGRGGSAGVRSAFQPGASALGFALVAVLGAVTVVLAAERADKPVLATIAQNSVFGTMVPALTQFGYTVKLAGRSNPSTAHADYLMVNRMAGLELCALAMLALEIACVHVRTRWMQWWGVATAVVLAEAAIGYELLNGLAGQAYVAIPMFLLYVAATGLVLRRGQG